MFFSSLFSVVFQFEVLSFNEKEKILKPFKDHKN